jgi:RHS repeat-associated protein
MVLDENGTVKEALMYQPYGAVSDVQGISAPRTDPLRQKFTTKEFDEEGIPTNDADINYQLTIYVPDDQYTITGEITYASEVSPVLFDFDYHDATVGDNYYNHYGSISSVQPNTNITSIVLHVIGPSGLNFDYTLDGLNYPVPAGYSRTITLARTIAKIQEAAGAGEKLYDFGELVEFPVDISKNISSYYFGARFFNPDLGLWFSTDPVDQYWNTFSYCGGDPINFIDPDGTTGAEFTSYLMDAVLVQGFRVASTAASNATFVGAMFLFMYECNQLGHAISNATFLKEKTIELPSITSVNDIINSQSYQDFLKNQGNSTYLNENTQSGQEGQESKEGVVEDGTEIVVTPDGNAIPVGPGEKVTGSPDGKWVQVRDPNGNPTGTRIDQGHKPSTHPDPRAQKPHGHRPGVTNPDGTPWLPAK